MVLYSESIRNAAAEYLKKLSLREKIGQMVQFNSRNVNFLREKMSDAEIMARYPFGSYFSGSDVIDLIGHRIRGQEKLESVKAAAKIPLLIAGDLENGAGGEPLPNLIVLGATRDPELAFQFGKVLAQRSRCCGFHWAFGPVSDIMLNWLNPAVAARALGSDPDMVAELASQIIRGMQSEGFCATAKHFPGDGVDFRNQHIGWAQDKMSREEWNETFGKVYRKVIDAGVRSIMNGHIALPCVDDRGFPATISDRISTGLLRDELGFQGVLVTDALIMSGFVSFRNYEKRMIAMINAGADVMLWPEPDIFDLAEKAVAAGDIPESRVDEAARRVLEMKFACGLLGENKLPAPQDPGPAYDLASKKIAEKGTVLVTDRNHYLPLDPKQDKNILVVIADEPEKLRGQDLRKYPGVVHLLNELEARGASLTIKSGLNCMYLVNEEMHGVQYDAVLVLFTLKPFYAYRISGATLEMIWMMNNSRHTKVIAVSLLSPYLVTENPLTPATVINACSDCPASQRAAVRIIYGEIEANRQPPQDLLMDEYPLREWEKIHYDSVEN